MDWVGNIKKKKYPEVDTNCPLVNLDFLEVI